MRIELTKEIYSQITQKVKDFFDPLRARTRRRVEEGTTKDLPIFLGGSSFVSERGSSTSGVGFSLAKNLVMESTTILCGSRTPSLVRVKGVLLSLILVGLISISDTDSGTGLSVKDLSRRVKKDGLPGTLVGVTTLSIRLSLNQTVSLSRRDEDWVVIVGPRIKPV